MKVCYCCLFLRGQPLEHSYSAATCTTPATCSVCGAKGSSLGHSYKNGTCSRCGAKDPNYVKTTYSSGEYWIVDGQWKFTINSVTKHSLCNSFSNSRNGYTNEQVVTINYTYEHIGYSGSNQLGLIFNSSHFEVYDEDGYGGDVYACTHTNGAKYCSSYGTKRQAQEAYVLTNNSSTIKIVVKQILNGSFKKATYEIKVS